MKNFLYLPLLILLANPSYADDRMQKLEKLSNQVAEMILLNEDCDFADEDASKRGQYIQKLKNNFDAYVSCHAEPSFFEDYNLSLGIIRNNRFKNNPDLTLGEIRKGCKQRFKKLSIEADKTLENKEEYCEREDLGI